MEEITNPVIQEKGQFDTILFVSVLCLILVGVFMVYSATSVVAPSRTEAAAASLTDLRYLKKHLASIILGFVLMSVMYKMNSESLKKMALPLLILSILLLLAVKIPGIGATVNGARRWIRVLGITFQPSELVKLSLVLYMAKYLSGGSFVPDSVKAFAKPVGLMLVLQAMLLLQPDFGSAAIVGVITFALLFLAGVRIKYILSLGVVLIPVVVKLIMEPYRLKRVLVFLNPWADEKRSGFQLIQSFVALGNGGLDGVGIGKSTQKLFFLPEAKTDFIFAIVGEETGLIGAAFVVLLFFIVFLRGIFIVNRLKGGFYMYTAAGITLLISIQAVINMAVVSGLLPTKGLPLPFISYGGSSMVLNAAAIGILLNLSEGEVIVRHESPVITKEEADYKVNRRKGRIFTYAK
ncbi:putative lipid II flippase FtsW [Candidatus Magnetominusculus xianensis]|uniref:Probable peptidoglycan glycosyltransferase FtsW n=1 Tax=Candidatus Magnetominusculus xianensis TaxID=1748249 RepID=A0ABR5SGG2_9BACT|nr:putative lipid II flippase FtsW [Candidatus Magnetominusculus xianensis]KWT89807.1 cell division protein FtsW [Candidatus Magnetominusculus xianensis]MBF0404594.1 putative lipid II flippase FtsW [Nitrospirota bacterium]